MKLGQEVWIHGYIDEMRKDIAIIKNEGGYFGAVYDEIVEAVEAVNKAYEKGFKDAEMIKEYWGTKRSTIIADLDALCEKYGTTYGGIIEVLEDKLD